MQRKSLLDGEDFSGIGRRGGGGGVSRGGGGGMDSSKKVKIAIAAALFILAGGLLAWNFGYIGGGPVEEKVSPEKKAAREKQVKEDEEELERLQREGKVTVGGA